MDELIADFVADTGASLEQMQADCAHLAEEGSASEALLRLVRALHTIKGACGFLKLPRIGALAHACEGALLRWREGRGPPEAAELAETAIIQIKDILTSLAADGAEPVGDDAPLIASLAATPNALDWAIELASIRDRLLARANEALGGQIQMLRAAAAAASDPAATAPIAAAWKTLPLLVADLSEKLGKPLTLTVEGGDVTIAQMAVGPLRDALGHLIRNCADHGVETPAERKRRHKTKTATISLSAAREDDMIVIRLSDDGRGLDTARIRHRAISCGLTFASHAARMSPDQIHAFVFAPGFSTTETANALSGRGVGLDAARAGLEALGGAIALRSEPGSGTLFILTVPAPAPIEAALIAPPPDEAVPTPAAAIAEVA